MRLSCPVQIHGGTIVENQYYANLGLRGTHLKLPLVKLLEAIFSYPPYQVLKITADQEESRSKTCHGYLSAKIPGA